MRNLLTFILIKLFRFSIADLRFGLVARHVRAQDALSKRYANALRYINKLDKESR